ALVPTLLALAALLLVLSVQRRSGSLVVWTALAAGLAVNTYPTMKLYVPLLGLVALLIYRRDILRLKKVCLAYAAVVFVVLAGPVLYLTAVDPAARGRFDQLSILRRRNIDAALLARQYAEFLS